jgi:predicted MPP superfamily phosphohydrolase
MPISRRTALKGVLATTIGAVTGAGIYGGGYERHHLVLTEATLPVTGLPRAFDGLRVAFLTDLHHSALVPAADIVRAVDLANAQRPDLVILGGDYVTSQDRKFMEPVAELLAPLSAPLGVVAMLGNHDDDKEMPAALTRHDIRVLKDGHHPLTMRGERLDLVGIRFWTREPAKIAGLVRRSPAPVLLLAHDPRRLTEAAAAGAAAVLSGHTHGGQIVLPGLGAVAARKYPVSAGNGSLGGTSIFVSRGIGTVYLPVRINCPPEVALVTLRQAESKAPA